VVLPDLQKEIIKMICPLGLYACKLETEKTEMIQQIFGTINKRIDVGCNNVTGDIFIHSSSNCIWFTPDEMMSLLRVLYILSDQGISAETAAGLLSRTHIDMWEPTPPPAEVKI
jgi:hypothetical protein